MQITLTATTEQAGTRIDSFLAAAIEGLTRSAAARLLEQGNVTADGRSPANTLYNPFLQFCQSRSLKAS